MSALTRLLCAALLWAFGQHAAWPQDLACKLVGGGFNHLTVEERGELWTYFLDVSGPNWRTEPFGWHASGFLFCPDCSPKVRETPYYLGAGERDPDNTWYRHAPTVAERVKRGREWFGYLGMLSGTDQLRYHGSREPVVVGPLSGYAVLWRVPAAPLGDWGSEADIAEDATMGLLALHLEDSCALFGVNIVQGLRDEKSVWAVLDTLLKELSIERVHIPLFRPPP